MCRCVEKDWAADLDCKPKLWILNSPYVNGFDGRCWKVRGRPILMMLRGGTAPFQIETGRWKGIPQEERLCSVRGTRKWKTAIIGCYDVLGGNQKDGIF